MRERPSIDVSRLIDEGKLPRVSIVVCAVCFFMILTEGYDNLAMSYVAPYLVKAWHIGSMARLGPVFTANPYGFIVGGVAFGSLGDRYGRRMACILSAVMIGIFTLASVASTTITELFVLRFLAGLGLGGVAANAVAITAEYSPKRFRSTMIILMYNGVPFGSALPGPVSATIGPVYGWQALFIIGGILPLIAALAAALWLPESLKFLVTTHAPDSRIVRAIRTLRPGHAVAPGTRFSVGDEAALRGMSPRLLFAGALRYLTPLVWLLFVCTTISFYTTTSWLPTLLSMNHISSGRSALALSAFTLGGFSGSLAICRPLDRWGFGVVGGMFALSIVTVCALGFGVGHGGDWLMAMSFFAGFCLLGAQSGLNAGAIVIYPTGVRSMAAGWAHAVGKIVGSWGPVILGILLSLKWPVTDLFLLLGVPLGIGTIAAFAMARVYERGTEAAPRLTEAAARVADPA